MNLVVLKDDPRISLLEDFLTPDQCAHLLATATPQMHPAEVIDPLTGGAAINEYRTGLNYCFQKGQDLVIQEIEGKIAKTCGVRPAQLEYIQVNKYSPGELFKPHQDWLDSRSEGHKKQMAGGGQRIMSVVIYLNVPEEGGETVFDAIHVRVTPQIGAALVWINVDEKYGSDPRVMHESLPVVRGEKWIATCWIRERAFDGSEEEAHRLKQEKKATSEAELRKQLEEIRKQNISEAHQEIMAIMEKRQLRLFPYPILERDPLTGKYEMGAALDLVHDPGARPR